MSPRIRIIIFSLLLAPLAARAQAPARYQAQADTQWVETSNPFRMYWVRGADTLGQGEIHSVSVESHVWRAAGERLEVVSRQLSLDVGRVDKVDTTTVLPNGVVVLINRRPPGVGSRTDFVLHLPAAPLAVGTEWADSLYGDTAAAAGHTTYAVKRTLRVTRMLDTLGTRVAEVSGRGTVRYRDAFAIDAEGSRFAWLDVTGPADETFWFDVRRGRELGRRWSMDLRGTGAIPNASGGMDTLPAGLLSKEWQRVVSAERAHLLARVLPGRDTTLTIADNGPILLHTVERSTSTVRSGMGRNDGLVGTARSDFAAGRVTGYAATWTDTAAAAVTQRITVTAQGLRVQREGHHDTTLALPAGGVWGIADYAMQEHLVPVLLPMATGQETPIHVYRPTAAHWDQGTVQVRRAGGIFVATLRMEGAQDPELLIITPEGDLLYGANSGPTGAERVPLPGSARRARLDAIVKELSSAPRS